MKLKHKIGDFRVRELLRPDYVSGAGPHVVYRVTKKKLTSLEAAAELAREAGVELGRVAMAGLKDRQGVTTQHMSIAGGRTLDLQAAELRVETVGRASSELVSSDSLGNAFELVVRDLNGAELARLRKNLDTVRSQGVVNYFDEQRFGNLRHGQGWIARQLMRGETEAALRTLLTSISPFEQGHLRAFKEGLAASWGDWQRCRALTLQFGQHRSLFEHLEREPDDLAGAFRFVATRIRLIHLYAYQSHLWNRVVAEACRELTEARERVATPSVEGVLLHPHETETLRAKLGDTVRLPGEELADVTHAWQRELFERVLEKEHLRPDQFRIEGVAGFAVKGEDRPLICFPEHLRVRPPEPDPTFRGAQLVKVRFELPRGSYATLVVRRLFAETRDQARSAAHDRDRVDAPRSPERVEPRGGDARDRDGGPGRGRREGSDRGPGGYAARRGSDRNDRRGSRPDRDASGQGRDASRASRSSSSGANRGYREGGENRGYREGGENRGYREGGASRGYREGGASRGYREGGASRGYREGGASRGSREGGNSRGYREGGSRGYREGGENRGHREGGDSRGYRAGGQDRGGRSGASPGRWDDGYRGNRPAGEHDRRGGGSGRQGGGTQRPAGASQGTGRWGERAPADRGGDRGARTPYRGKHGDDRGARRDQDRGRGESGDRGNQGARDRSRSPERGPRSDAGSARGGGRGGGWGKPRSGSRGEESGRGSSRDGADRRPRD